MNATIQVEGVTTVVGTTYPYGLEDWNFLDGAPDIVPSDITLCGHSVSANVLDELGYTDYVGATCHECLYYDGKISEELFNELLELESN